MITRLVQTIDEFNALRPDWNRLVDSLEHSEPFYCWEWANANIAHRLSSTDALFLVVIEHDRELLAIAPLCIERENLGPLTVRTLRTITGDHADYGSFYLHPGRNHRLLLRKIFTTLFEHRDRWDTLHLLNFNSRNPQTFLIGELVQSEFGVSCCFGEQVMTPFIRFGKEDIKLGRKHLRDIDRRERNLRKNHRVDIRVDGPFSEELWKRLVELHLAKWPASVLRCPRNRAFFRQIIRDLAPEGRTAFSWITVDGEIAAIEFGFRNARKRLAYIPVYDPKFNAYSLGGIMLKHLLAHYGSTMEEFDFLRGNEPYKFEWTDLVAANHNLLIDNGRPRGRIVRDYLRLKDGLRRVGWLKKIAETFKGRRSAPSLPPAPTPAPAPPAPAAEPREPVTA